MDKNKKHVIIGLVVLISEILLLYYLWENNTILTILLSAISFLVLINFSNMQERILYFACFFLGPAFDLILVPRGVWTYANPSIFGVPIWLPVTYGLGAVMIVKIATAVSKMASR